jgi:predicted PurR-regulated permease PerM
VRLSNGQLSSSVTFIYKFVFPAIWTMIGGVLLFVTIEGIQRTTFPDTATSLLIVVPWLLGIAFLLWFAAPILRVELRDGRLYASNYRREIEIQRSDIVRVTQNVWVNVRPITLHLRNETPFGTRIRFIPPGRVVFAFWREDPMVEKLRELAGLPPSGE